MNSDSRAVLGRVAPPADQTFAYGTHPDQVVDLRFPAGHSTAADAGAAAPDVLLVLWHGGFWQSAYDRVHLGSMAHALSEAGHLVAVPEYRRVGTPGGGWPGTFDDVAAGLDAIRARFPATRCVFVGHSAGGQLALWAAGRHRLDGTNRWHSRSTPDGVVVLAGCSALVHCAEQGLGEGAAAALLGGLPREVPERYAVADPLALLPLGVRVALVHGTEDLQVPIGVSRMYAKHARAAGDPLTVHELAGVEHFGLIDPLSVAWSTVLTAIEGFTNHKQDF